MVKFFDNNKDIFKGDDKEHRRWAIKALDDQRFIFGVVQTVKVRGQKELVCFEPVSVRSSSHFHLDFR